MMHPATHQPARKPLILTAAVCAASIALLTLGGCAEEPPPVVIAPPPPPPPAEPEVAPVTSIADLMIKYDIDTRINLAEADAPATDVLRIAVLKFYDAFARGNSEAVKGVLASEDQIELDRIVANGEFKANTDPITRIDVRCKGGDDSCGTIAIYHVAEQFQPQFWLLEVHNSNPTFEAVSSPPGIMNLLSGNDHIQSWRDIIKAEMAKADEPDEVVVVPQQDFTKTEVASAESSGGGETAPGAPAGAPGKRAPGTPIKPPKPPGFGTK